jgi:rhamnulokinase
MGLWIVQQCRATWQAAGDEYSYPELVGRAESAPPLRSIINVNDDSFLPHGDHPALIRKYLAQHGQAAPEDVGATVRCVLESLALAYRDVFEKLEAISGRGIDTIHIIGGGSENPLLNQMTADATGKMVMAGPVEATVIGNALMQLITLGEIGNLQEARQLLAGVEPMKCYDPAHSSEWEEAYERYKTL